MSKYSEIRPPPPPPPDNNLTQEITLDEIRLHIRQLKNTKAPGPDKIKPILLKQLPKPACQALLNNCLNTSYFPKSWKTTATIMIPRKIFEKILNTCFKTILETDNISPQQQFGFRPQHSITNPILELHTDSTRHANLKECTIAVLLDMLQIFYKMKFKTILKEIKHYIPSKKYIKKMKLLKYKAKYKLFHQVGVKHVIGVNTPWV
jgi:hypothetical protein